MKKLNKVLVSGVVITSLVTGGIALADSMSLKDEAISLIAQLKQIAQENKLNFSAEGESKQKYIHAIETIYQTLGLSVPSEDELNNLTSGDIEALLQEYAKKLDSDNIGADSDLYKQIKAEVEQDIIQQVNSSLQTDYTDIEQMLAELQGMKATGESDNGARANYLNKLQAIYMLIDGTQPTEEQLMAMSYDQVANDVQTWANNQTNEGITNSLEEHKQMAYNEIAEAIGMEGEANVTNIQLYVENLESMARTEGQGEGQAEMQEVVNELKATINELGGTVNDSNNNSSNSGNTSGNDNPTVVTPSEQETAYNNLSDKAKEIVDYYANGGTTQMKLASNGTSWELYSSSESVYILNITQNDKDQAQNYMNLYL